MARYGCAGSCMDGRGHPPVRKFAKRHYHVDFVDIVSLPGINKFLANYRIDRLFWLRLTLACLTFRFRRAIGLAAVYLLRWMYGISARKHNAEIFIIAAHPDCAGNPADKAQQIQDLIKASENIESWGYEIPLVRLWTREDWKTVEVVSKDGSILAQETYDVRVPANF